MKTCSKCKAEKATDLFSKDAARPDGLTNWCKQCRRTHYLANKDRVAKQMKVYSAENKDKLRINAARHYEKNKDLVLQRSMLRYYANIDKIQAQHRESGKKYSRLYPERNLVKRHKRRARLRSNGVFTITNRELKTLYSLPCFYCGNAGGSLDHVVPIARGGAHGIGNIVPACMPCNMSKGSKLLSQWKRDVMKYGKIKEGNK